jgi:hypothetical protein
VVAIADVGRTAAELLQESSEGNRVVELEGPQRVSKGFNEGWLTFEHEPRKGDIGLDAVLQSLIELASSAHRLAGA